MDQVGVAAVSILASLGIVGAVGVLFRTLMAAKDEQIAWLREDNRELRAALRKQQQTNERAVAVVEEAAPARARARATRRRAEVAER
jgi:hypothetical protein